MWVWFVFGFMCAIVILFIAAYFKFAALHKAVIRAKKRLDAQCKKRHDLIPNLALSGAAIPALGSSFAYSLNGLKEKCANADTLLKCIAHEAAISRVCHELFEQADKNKQLYLDEHFEHLRQSLIRTEGRIQKAKKRYNSAVRDFNTLAAIFPLNLIARLLEFSPFEYFDFDKSI